MALDASILTRKYGPLPGYAWAGAAALGAWFLLRNRGGTATVPNAAAAGSQLQSGYGLGYAQGLQSAGPATTTAGPAPTRSANASIRQGKGPSDTLALFERPSGGNIIAWVPVGARVHAEPQQGANLITLPSGTQGWLGNIPDQLYGPNVIYDTTSTGVGGPGALGSRSAALWAPHHPLVPQAHRYPHFVRAVGGAPNHAKEVIRVANQAGVHPARMMMLNPRHTGWLRVA